MHEAIAPQNDQTSNSSFRRTSIGRLDARNDYTGSRDSHVVRRNLTLYERRSKSFVKLFCYSKLEKKNASTANFIFQYRLRNVQCICGIILPSCLCP